MRILWTDEDKTIVKNLFDQGKTYAEIANAMKRTQQSVKGFVQRNRSFFGLSTVVSCFVKRDDHEKIKTLWAEQKTHKEISNIIGITPNQLQTYLQHCREDFPKRKDEETNTSWVKKPKPTPENTVIQYEFKEFDMPKDALMISFYQVKSGECTWVLQTFWEEPKYDSPCCGLPVFDKRGKGLRRQYCEFHYKISVEEVK